MIASLYITAVLLTLAVAMGFVNEKILNLPGKIGNFLLATLLALGIMACEKLAPGVIHGQMRRFIMDMNFGDVLISGALSFLLYAGAFRIPLPCLQEEKKLVAGLAFLSTTLNTVLMGTLIWGAFLMMPYDLTYLWALVFGALVSPTDPLSALGILTKIGLPKRLEAILIGESLFNDGVAFVLFTILSGIALGDHSSPVRNGLTLFAREVGGGIMIGGLFAALAHILVRHTNDKCFHMLVSVTTVVAGYALCLALHVSGPIAMAVAGLVAGSYTFGASRSDNPDIPDISRREQRDIDLFWVLIDDILNAVLFVMIGLQLVRVPFGWEPLLTGIAAIISVLASRYISVFTTANLLHPRKKLSEKAGMTNLLTWAGLRGGLSVAMALTLPEGDMRTLLLDMTFAVVAFSLLAQGLSIKLFFSGALLQKLSISQARKNR